MSLPPLSLDPRRLAAQHARGNDDCSFFDSLDQDALMQILRSVPDAEAWPLLAVCTSWHQAAQKVHPHKPPCVLKWLHEDPRAVDLVQRMNKNTCARAVQRGDLHSLQWLLSNGCHWYWGACDLAARHGHTEVREWLLRHGRNCSLDRKRKIGK